MTQSEQPISTGLPDLDAAIGIGGIPRGRLTEIFGPSGSGKTSLALRMVAAAQAQGLTCAWIDCEHTLDLTYARRLGVDTSALIVAQPSGAKEAYGMAVLLARDVALTVLDSALVARDIDDRGLLAKGLRGLTAAGYEHGATAILTSRTVAGALGRHEAPNAPKFYASLRLHMRPEDGRIRVAKNKHAAPFRDCAMPGEVA